MVTAGACLISFARVRHIVEWIWLSRDVFIPGLLSAGNIR